MVFGITSWYGMVDVFVASIPCYFFCYLGVVFGKRFISSPYLGGYLGGLGGVLSYILILHGLFFCMVSMAK